MAQNEERIQRQYEDAKAVYAGFGVDTDEALAEFRRSGVQPARPDSDQPSLLAGRRC